jgi:molybdopterin biosynthesis enzyme
VRPRGGDARSGDVVVPAGRVLRPAQLGALAAAGVSEVVCSLSRALPSSPPGAS